MGRRILVPWFLFSLNGGIARFIRASVPLEAKGHSVSFCSLLDQKDTPWPELAGRILTLEEARRRGPWEAVMVPGAGAPEPLLRSLGVLRDPAFGVRVQHVLNDPSRRAAFRAVNRALRPHVVVFNNRHWRLPEWHDLEAEAYHVLPGAVDTRLHRPEPGRPFPRRPPQWEVGALASKHLSFLLEALELLPETFRFHLFGALPAHTPPLLVRRAEEGRVKLHGPLTGEALAAFYRSLDAVVAVEAHAGWCNIAAEGFAHGLPCVVGRAGTLEFARPEENCLLLEAPDPDGLANRLLQLAEDPRRAAGLGAAAARAVSPFSYEAYAEGLLHSMERPAFPHYVRAPELGLFGKWDAGDRIRGLAPLFPHARGAAVLDLGCAEGLVSRAFAREGRAACIHGFDLDPGRVAFSRNLLAREPGITCAFRPADLSDWPAFREANRDLLLPRYEVVLFLGVYHHLPEASRRASLEGALDLCGRWFALRTGIRLLEQDGLEGLLRSRGFRLRHTVAQEGARGWLGLFERV